MADPPTREEVDAKLAALEARSEARLIELRSEMSSVLEALQRLSADVRNDMAVTRSEGKSLRTTIFVTGIGLAIAIVAAVWTIQSDVLTAFQAGLSTVQAVRQK
jgi:hypothetical protein